MAKKSIQKRRKFSRKLGAIATAFLWTTPALLWALMRPVTAQTAPGTIIENTATGSFVDTSDDQTKNIFSNTVRVTVVEVAGIGVTFNTVREATIAEAGSNAGTYQDIDGVNTGDLVFFDFVVTNVGNDPTTFFIPAAPASVTGGTFSAAAPIQIIAVDPDGSGTGYTAITNLNGSGGSFNVTTAGTTTTLLGTNNGYIPPGGTVTVRVPVKVTATAIASPITVVLGDTSPVGAQNQDYAANTNDLYTADLPNGTSNPYTSPATVSEADGSPLVEKEASAQGSVNLDPFYQLNGYKSVKMTTDANSENTINEGDTLTWTIYYVNTGTGNLTDVQITDALPSDVTYVPGSLTISTGNTTTFPNNLSSGTQPTANSGFNGNSNTALFTSAIALAPNEIVKIEFQTTINTGGTVPRTAQNQATATGKKNGGAAIAPVLTDNIDDIPAVTLPNNITIPTNSITQTENPSIDPTQVPIVAVTNARDYGDAPDTGNGTATDNYQTTLTDGGASQAISTTLRLGTLSDADDGTLQNTNANADDNNNLDDEDAVSILPYFSTAAGLTYSVPVFVTNSTGANAYLRGYVDFNRDGDFNDTNETSAIVSVPTSGTNPQTVQLTFTSPTGLTAGTTYARLRLSSVQSDLNSPSGASSNPGEIEDYAVSINTFGTPPTLSCPTTPRTFVWGDTPTASNYYSYVRTAGTPPEAIFVNIADSLDLRLGFAGNVNLLTNSATVREASTTTNLAILTGTELFSGGRTPAESNLILNISGARDQFVTTKIDFLDKVNGVNNGNLVEIQNVNFTIFDVDNSTNNWQDRIVVRGYDKNNNLVYPSLFINPSNASDNPGHQFYNGAINDVIATGGLTPNSGAGSAAGNVGVTFTQPITRFEIDYYNGPNGPAPSGNHAIGLIGSIQFCDPPYDFGDAPNTYPTTVSNGGARHIITDKLRIGTTAPDGETDAATPLNGTGDNATNVNDENTVTITGLAVDATTYSLNIPVTNTSGYPATLVGWIDFDRDGIFQADEGVTANVSNGVTDSPVTLTWNNLGSTGPNIVAGTTHARFRLTTDTINTSNAGGSLGGGEVEDYNLTINSLAAADPNLILVKRITAIERDGVRQNFTTYKDDNMDPNFPDNPNDNAALWPGYNSGDFSNSFTVGELGIEAIPGDVVDYTIYFLNTGGSNASAVKICDLLSQYLTYIPNSYDGGTPTDGGLSNGLGITLNFAGTTVYLSGVAGDGADRGQFVGANIVPTNCVVEDPAGSNSFRAATGSDNKNGTVVVNLSSVSPATSAGTPNTSYGYIRFRATVK